MTYMQFRKSRMNTPSRAPPPAEPPGHPPRRHGPPLFCMGDFHSSGRDVPCPAGWAADLGGLGRPCPLGDNGGVLSPRGVAVSFEWHDTFVLRPSDRLKRRERCPWMWPVGGARLQCAGLCTTPRLTGPLLCGTYACGASVSLQLVCGSVSLFLLHDAAVCSGCCSCLRLVLSVCLFPIW